MNTYFRYTVYKEVRSFCGCNGQQKEDTGTILTGMLLGFEAITLSFVSKCSSALKENSTIYREMEK
jgi:hypothetical protein